VGESRGVLKMGKIKCYSCGEIFERRIPKHEGLFPVYRVCPECKTKNYLFDLDNGEINEGCIGD